MVLVYCVVSGLLALPSLSFDLVRSGKPSACIVIPIKPYDVEEYAARELQYHVRVSTGAELMIVREGQSAPTSWRIYLGQCRAAAEAGIDPAGLPGNGYRVMVRGRRLFIVGKDSIGDPLDPDTHAGTLFGVYDVLENNMGVRWLWPGRLGEVVPKQKSISLNVCDASVRPLLLFKRWRLDFENGLLGGKSDFASDEKYRESNRNEKIWLRRQRFGRSSQPNYHHAFTTWWDKYGKANPEYFNMLPDGTRRPDPRLGGSPEIVHMCVSQPALCDRIVENWKADDAPESLNLCENDTDGACTCPNCMAWDVPVPGDPAPFDQRLKRAKELFDNPQPGIRWPRMIGTVSDRYARYLRTVYGKAAEIRPDVKVYFYAYSNYRKPPLQTKLDRNVIIGIVPPAIFPYNKHESEEFRRDWTGWSNAGCSLFLRPNYTLQGHDFPVFYARTLGEDLKFAMHHSMRGVDFDSLTGQYATQGPTLYVLSKILNHPDESVEKVLDEFYSAFGPAQSAVKEYFDYWEQISSPYDYAAECQLERKNKKYGANELAFYGYASDIYTPDVMKHGWALLDRASKLAASEPMASLRVDWLVKGLKHVDLTLAVAKARAHAVDTGETADLVQAENKLKAYRMSISDDNVSNFAWLKSVED